MGSEVQTISRAWKIYDRWLGDPGVTFWNETSRLDSSFRTASQSFSTLSSPKALGDIYLLAVSQTADANLVTLDRALAAHSKSARHPFVLIE